MSKNKSIPISIALSSEAFKCIMKVHQFPWWHYFSANPPSKKLPKSVQEMKFDFSPPINPHLPQLDFFRTQNVFAPGKTAIEATRTIAPYDFVVLGDIPHPLNMLPPAPTNRLSSNRTLLQSRRHDAWNNLRAAPAKHYLKKARSLATAPDVERGKALFETVYTDELGFAREFVSAVRTGEPSLVDSFFKSKGYSLDTIGTNCMDALSVPGPDFDLRFVGGMYSLETGDTTTMIFVNPKTSHLG